MTTLLEFSTEKKDKTPEKAEENVMDFVNRKMLDLKPANTRCIIKEIAKGTNYRINFHNNTSNIIVKSVFVKVVKTPDGLNMIDLSR